MHFLHPRTKVKIILQHLLQLLHQKSILVFHQFAELFYFLRHYFALFAITAQKGQDRHNDLYDFIEHFNKLRIEN